MNIFEAVKQSVTTWQAAESYGIRVNKNGMCYLQIKAYLCQHQNKMML